MWRHKKLCLILAFAFCRGCIDADLPWGENQIQCSVQQQSACTSGRGLPPAPGERLCSQEKLCQLTGKQRAAQKSENLHTDSLYPSRRSSGSTGISEDAGRGAMYAWTPWISHRERRGGAVMLCISSLCAVKLWDSLPRDVWERWFNQIQMGDWIHSLWVDPPVPINHDSKGWTTRQVTAPHIRCRWLTCESCGKESCHNESEVNLLDKKTETNWSLYKLVQLAKKK